MSTNSLDPINSRHQLFQPMDQWFWPTSGLVDNKFQNNNNNNVNSNCDNRYPVTNTATKSPAIPTTSTTTMSSTSAKLQRRHNHWWKVCWIYNNGQFICHQQSKQTNFKQFHQQIRSLSTCSAMNSNTVFNDRCGVNRDDQMFSNNKQNNGSTGAVGAEPQMKAAVNGRRSLETTKALQQQQSYPQLPARDHPQPQHYATLPGHSSHQTLSSTLPPMPSSSPPSMPASIHSTRSMSSCSSVPISSSATSGFLQQRLTQPFTALLKQRSENKNSNISQFFIHFKGPEWRAEQLKYQMPSHDIQMFKLQTNEVKFVRNQQRKAQIKPQLFLNKTINYCFKCRSAIENGAYGVKISVAKNGNQNIGFTTTADDEDSSGGFKAANSSPSDAATPPTLNGSTALYHIQCFTCEECREVLVDLKAFLYTNHDPTDTTRLSNTLYCSRHFVELFKPRCQSCDHLIFDEECTEAEGKAWHLGHFACYECKRSLGGQQYIMADPSKQSDKKSVTSNPHQSEHQKRNKQLPYCLTCFDILFGELCEECGELIGCDVGAISHEGRSWHAVDVCFKCNHCSKPLLGKPFLPAFDGRIYCSIVCSQQTIQRNRNRDRRKIRSNQVNCVQDNHTNHNNNIISNNNNNNNFNDLSKSPENCPNNSYSSMNGQNVKQSMNQTLQMRPNNEQNYYQNKLPFNDKHRHPVDEVVSELSVKDLPQNGLKFSNSNHQRSAADGNEFYQKFNEIKLNETTDGYGLVDKPKANDFVVSVEDNHQNSSTNATNNSQNLANNEVMNQQMLDYIQRYHQMNRPPDYVMDYMRQQLFQNGLNGRNDIIGATIECGSSLSEDEQRVNHQVIDHHNRPAITATDFNTQHNYNHVMATPSKTSSNSSSLNINPFEPNNGIIATKSALKYNPSITSSSAETTPLLLRSLEERAKQLTQTVANQPNISQLAAEKPKIFSDQSLPKSESPSQSSQNSQTSQTTQSSSSSLTVDNNSTNLRPNNTEIGVDVRKTVEVDTPSTQSTALQSTGSSETTPEINPRQSTNKSVTFDPSVKEPTGGRRVPKKSRSRPARRERHSELSDNHSCSTCSTCSSCSSSSDDDYYDYGSTIDRNRQQWLGGTKIQYVSNDRKKNVSQTSPNTSNTSQTAVSNESCTIS